MERELIYDLSVFGPNGFVRYFKGSVGATAVALDVRAEYEREEIEWHVKNVSSIDTKVTVLDAYTGNQITRQLRPHKSFDGEAWLGRFHGWYDLIVTVVEDSTLQYRLAGHVETGRPSFSDPALGGLVTLKG
jgi:phospholipase C